MPATIKKPNMADMYRACRPVELLHVNAKLATR